MYSVLIVDDEEPVLESYTYMIEHGAPDFTVCGKARSGEKTYKKRSQSAFSQTLSFPRVCALSLSLSPPPSVLLHSLLFESVG